MEPKTLRLKAAGTAMVPIFEKIPQGIRQFVGREYREVEPGVHGFAPTDRIDEVPNRAEYREAVKTGDALPADAESAAACGVAFGAAAAAKQLPTAPTTTKDGDK